MDTIALISVLCEDNPGLIAAITGRLYDIGANLGDTTFAVLGGAAEFTAVCELPEGVSLASVEADLARLPALASAKLSVTPFGYQPVHADQAHITHRIEITGKDSPGPDRPALRGLPAVRRQYRAAEFRAIARRRPCPLHAADGGVHSARQGKHLPRHRRQYGGPARPHLLVGRILTSKPGNAT